MTSNSPVRGVLDLLGTLRRHRASPVFKAAQGRFWHAKLLCEFGARKPPFLTKIPQGLAVIVHSDTEGIAFFTDLSIPIVSDSPAYPFYPSGMAQQNNRWLDWGIRLRAHVRENKDVKWGQIADKLKVTEGGIRHWCNGTRPIQLGEFFKLCDAAKADPAQILFGRPQMSEEQRKRLGDMVVSVLESDPAVAPHYNELIRGIQQSPADGKQRQQKPRP